MPRNSLTRQRSNGTHVWLVLWKAYKAVQAFSLASVDALELSLTDFAILEALLHKGPMPVNDIGRKVSLTSGSMTIAVDRLAQRGLVERRNDQTDRRTRVVHLTAAGRSLIECAFAEHAKSLDHLGEALTAKEREEIIRLLKKFGRAAEASLGHPPA